MNTKENSVLSSKFKVQSSALWADGWFPVSEKDLPVLLPDLSDWKPEGTGKGPLAKLSSFVKVKCPHCGKEAERETDVCDTFLDSSWYFLRYPSVNLESAKDTPGVTHRGSPGVEESELPWDRQITRRWLPVTQYIGGAEHTVLHLLYSRFVWMCFYDWGLFNFSAKGGPASGWDEPFSNFYAHGLIIAEGAKMSKSKGNIVIPDEYIKKYGADTLRAYLMFLGPFDQGGDFRDTGIAGMHRFLSRVWRLANSVISNQLSVINRDKRDKPTTDNRQLTTVMHKTIKEVTEDLENLRYNTAIAHIMEFVNHLTDNRQLITDSHIKSLLLMLAPFAPHMTEELWYQLSVVSNQKSEEIKPTTDLSVEALAKADCRQLTTDFRSIHLHPWPTYDPKYLVEDTVTIVVQVNGKLRDLIELRTQNSLPAQAGKLRTEVEKEAKKSERVKKYIEGKIIRKVIFVPGKLINFVTPVPVPIKSGRYGVSDS